MSTADKDAPKRPQPNSTGVLHQRRSMPFSPATMAVGGFLIVATIGYFTLYHKSKPGTRPSDVVRDTVGDRGRDHNHDGYKPQ